MSESKTEAESSKLLPKAKVEKRKWRFPFVWVVPLVAAIVAGYLVFQRVREFGPEITIRFKDASGLRLGQTRLEYRGVRLGEVAGVELSKDQQHALVKVHLKRSMASVAREGSLFWIVRPQVGMANITGLGTIISGPRIEVLPGRGKLKSQFTGLETSPVALETDGLKIVLLSRRLEASKAGSPVYYRGVEVGAVNDCQLSTNAAMVETHVFIKRRYANLVRGNSKFWNVSGIDAKFGLFRGLDINVESLKSLVVGAISFATPDDPNDAPVREGAEFALHEEPKKEWLEWNPAITIPPAE